MLKNLKLGAKFNLILILVFISGIFISGITFSSILERRAENEVVTKASILLETMVAVRKYTSDEINPLLSSKLDTEEQFLPQTVSAFSAREVFENLRKKPEYSNFFYKEAAINPTNPRDKADDFETEMFQRFHNEPGLKKLQGFRSVSSGKLFYVARPLTVSKESCLHCHSTPEVAPKSQLAVYGKDGGFGWKLNDIIAAQILSIPASDVINSSRQALSLVMGILIAIFSVAILTVNFLLKRAVIKPLTQMSQVAKQVSTGNMDEEFEHKSADEIGILASSFNRMKVSLQMALNMLNQSKA